MIGVVTGKKEFSTADHIQVVKEERRDGKKYRDGTNGAKTGGIINDQATPRNVSSYAPITLVTGWYYGVPH